MSGHWEGSNRRDSLPSDWEQRVTAVKKRSKGRCEWPTRIGGQYRRCHNTADGGVDHFKGRLYHELDGLRDSCQFHHGKKSSQEGNDAKKAIRTRGRRPQEPTPGSILRRK